MCSIIAANNQADLDLAFLENRDKPKELFIGDDIRKIGDVVGIYDFRAHGIACGYSIRSKTAGGVANILGYTGPKSRGVLLLEALQKGRSALDSARIIESKVASGEYGSATYVICDRNTIVNVESFGKKVKLTSNGRKKFVVTTNHFRILREGKKSENSVLREKYMQTLGTISEESVLKLATRHRNPSICRHGRTLASFAVFQKRGEKLPRILYSIGEPCNGYNEFAL
ncbi:MAG: hypothetical protein M1587_02940 [Thaumarchaeota archaeon]|nr:hypothetical protein [Nitrososphaerota archaeon]MCL5067458.1 hypothetical protein [Nitrososphaerota archaeon]MDG6906129.1 hypothetical protein [Nitrososphaerota archaeon]